jgi:glutamate 5-kinase
MRTKIDAAQIATTGGTHMIIADGRGKNPLRAIMDGGRCTWFLTPSNPATARKTWIAGALEPRGALHVDAGAAKALKGGASLLPVGVTRVEGVFRRGDAVAIRDPEGGVLGRGLVAYDIEEAKKIIGRASREIEALLGYPGRAAMVHRDDMALARGAPETEPAS